jgi:hypothetical protein
MRFLVTTSQEESLEELKNELAVHGGEMAANAPVPLDEGDQVLEVEGPDDLPQKIEGLASVKKVSPDSEIDLH